VSYLVKVVPYWSLLMVLSTILQLSNVKPTQVCSAPADRYVISTITGGTSKGIMTSIMPLKMPKDYVLEQQRTGSQYHYIVPLTL
jgi:hypothetical protein